MAQERISVEVAWIENDVAVVCVIDLPPGACVADALARLDRGPLPDGWISVWGKAAGSELPLRSGDRVELCPPLLVEPKKRRRERAVNFRRTARS